MNKAGYDKALEIQSIYNDKSKGIDLGYGWRAGCITAPERGSICIASKEIYEIEFFDKFKQRTIGYVHSFEYDLSEKRLMVLSLLPKASIGDNVNSIFTFPKDFKDTTGNLIPIPEVIFTEYWDKAFRNYQKITDELHQVIKQHMFKLPARYHELQKMKEDRVAFDNIILDGSPSTEFYCRNIWKIQTQPEYPLIVEFINKIKTNPIYKSQLQKFKAMTAGVNNWLDISPKKYNNLNQLRLNSN